VMIFHSGALLLVVFEVYDKSDLQTLMHQRLRQDGKRRSGGSAFVTGCNKSIKFCKYIQNAGNNLFITQPVSVSFVRYIFQCSTLPRNIVEHKIRF